MPRIFVSYAHKDQVFCNRFIEVLKHRYQNRPDVIIWYDRNLTAGVDWWKEIMHQLNKTDIFIYLMSQTALNSEHCQAEFREAYRLRKQIITVQVDKDLNIDNDKLSAIQYVDLTNGLDHADSRQDLLTALDHQLSHVPPVRLLPPRSLKRTPQPNKPDTNPNAPVGNERTLREPMDINTRLAYTQTVLGAVGLVISIIALVFAYIQISNGGSGISRSESPTKISVLPTSTAIPIPLPTTAQVTPIPETPPTLTGFEQLQTAQAVQTQQMQIQQTLNAQETQEALATQVIGATETIAYATLLALSATPTIIPTATLTPYDQAINNARTFTWSSDASWEPFSHVFDDGVERVLVPVGCFQMGSMDGDSDQKPTHEQCITEPFWLDKYEVTNALYGSVDENCSQYSSEPDQPRNCMTWFEAQSFCQAHGGNLPTEVQWEYAARGIESLVYPWGNEYKAEYVIGIDDPMYGNIKTAPVGSRPEGVSWVGTLDQAGNLWEWTSTAYLEYPYTPDDEQINNSLAERTLRGGAYENGGYNLRSADRFGRNPSDGLVDGGFRCALSLNSSGL